MNIAMRPTMLCAEKQNAWYFRKYIYDMTCHWKNVILDQRIKLEMRCICVDIAPMTMSGHIGRSLKIAWACAMKTNDCYCNQQHDLSQKSWFELVQWKLCLGPGKNLDHGNGRRCDVERLNRDISLLKIWPDKSLNGRTWFIFFFISKFSLIESVRHP
jgi:hypothetical protein